MPRKVPEIMAPAGDFINLSAALDAGADAVYFGLKGSNMRAGAKNFEVSDMKKIAKMCAASGANAYLTLNTIYFENELGRLASEIRAAKRAGISAVIAWDFAAVEIARAVGMPVFLSTQASAANSASIAALAKNFGIRRFVLARECSLSDIPKIRRALSRSLGADAREIEFEIFAHGAMCVSISGRCFLSEFACGKSANRGECLQLCRREYEIFDKKDGESFSLGSNYVLSPKDLCTLPFIEKLFEAGVDSLKIEGRNRNAEYVFAAVSAYRRARDFYFANRRKADFAESFSELKNSLMDDLGGVFNRGFSSGFYMGRPVGDWTSSGNAATSRKVIAGHVLNYYPKVGAAEISIDAAAIRTGDILQFEGDATGFFRMRAESLQMNRKPVLSAEKGQVVAVAVPRKVRRLDRVFKVERA